jgi:PAS domain S-box-containing protein
MSGVLLLFKLTNISVLLFISTLINFAVASISWQRRKSKAGLYFALGVSALAFWTLTSGFDYAAVPISLKVFFAKLEYIGYNCALAFFVLLAIHYAGYESWLKHRWVKALFWIIPLSSILLALTNELHEWLWTGFTRSEFGENIVIFQHGPAFIWTAVTGYLAIALIVAILWSASRKGETLAKRQSRLLFYALLVPVFGNIIYLLDIEGIQGIDWSSILFTISGIILLVALYGTRFLDLVPIARRTVFERMGDSVLVLDSNNNLVDFNLSAVKNFGFHPNDLGNPIGVVKPNWPEIVKLTSSSRGGGLQITHVNAGRSRVFETRLTLLVDAHGDVNGKLLVFRDITEQYQAERALGERVKEMNSIYELSLLVEKPDVSLDEILQGSVNLIANAMQYPDRAYARLLVEDRSFTTRNYKDTGKKLSHPISIDGREIGMLEVGHLEDLEEEETFLFGEDERRLLQIIAERLGKIIQRLRLEAGRNLMSATMDILPVGVCLTDEGGHYQMMNEAYCAIYEYDREEMLGQHYSVIMPPDQIELANAHYARLLSGDVGIPVERKRQRKDGSIVYIEASNALIKDADGKKMVITTVSDITEKYWGEKALQENENLMRTVAENYPNSYLLIVEEDFTIGFTSGNEYKKQNLEPGQFIGVALEEFFEDQAIVIQQYCEKTFSGKEQEFELFIKKQNQLFRTVPLYKEDGSIPHILVVVENVTNRRQIERLNRFRLELWEYSISHSLDELMQMALDEICTLISSPIGFYHFVEDDQKTLSLQAWSTRTLEDFCQTEGKGLHYELNRAGVWVDAFHQKKPVIQNDNVTLPHHKGMPEGYAEVFRQLVVPVLRDKKVVLILGVGNKPSDYDKDDVELVSSIADLVWTIVSHKRAQEKLYQTQVQLGEQQRELARNEERQRMARDLHDSVSQSIHSMVLFSETLAATIEKGNFERAGRIMERLQESARQSHKETRLLLYELQAEGPRRSVDLIRDLEARLERVERHSGVRSQLTLDGALEHCPPEWHVNLFWITIEALNNALKHAQARFVQVVIRSFPDCMELEVTDNGKGFDPGKNRIGGMGLNNMRTRAEEIGGALAIESNPGRGTKVRFVGDPGGPYVAPAEDSRRASEVEGINL